MGLGLVALGFAVGAVAVVLALAVGERVSAIRVLDADWLEDLAITNVDLAIDKLKARHQTCYIFFDKNCNQVLATTVYAKKIFLYS